MAIYSIQVVTLLLSEPTESQPFLTIHPAPPHYLFIIECCLTAHVLNSNAKSKIINIASLKASDLLKSFCKKSKLYDVIPARQAN